MGQASKRATPHESPQGAVGGCSSLDHATTKEGGVTMKTEREERLAMRPSGRGPFPTLFGLVSGKVLMSSGLGLLVQGAWAQESGVAASHGLDLVPGAPQWANHASSNARFRFTHKWQALKQAAGTLAPAPDAPSPHAGVAFGQTVFNQSSAALPQHETTLALDPL